MIKFGEWLPDVGPLENPGLILAQNVLPTSSGYVPFPSGTQQIASFMDGPGLGFISARDNQTFNTIYTFVGTADKLYLYNASGFTDESKGGGYATASGERWEFVQFGNDVIATNFSDPMQTITLGSPPFADLGGSPPRARHIAAIQNFLVAANTYDASDGYQPQRVRWAGIGSTTSWTVSAVTQADFQDLKNEGGYITRIIGGEFGLIFQEKSITRMQYIGSPLVFQFDLVESARGALTGGAVVQIGNNTVYLSQDGFFVFDGQQSIPIGDGKVDVTFFQDLDISNISTMCVDLYPTENIIVWSYKSINAMGPANDKLLMYNYSPNSPTRWAFANVQNYLLISPISKGYTLDGLDAVDTNLDTLTPSLDSPFWQGFTNALGYINTDFGVSIISGPPLNATIETGEAWLQEPNRTYITLIRPHIDLAQGTVTAQIAARNLESEPISFGPLCTLNAAGFIPVRANGRFMRAVFNITGSFSQAQGFDIISSTSVGRQ